MTTPDSNPDTSGTIDGAAPRDDVLVAGAPDINAPGMPPGLYVDPAPNRIPHKRKKAAEAADDGTPPPKRNASQEEWAEYAVDHRGCDKATAHAMSRDELIQVYGDGPVASKVQPESKSGAEDDE